MSAHFDEEIIQRVDDLGTTTWSGTAYRHTSRNRDPLSGIGARLNGARWNPRSVFSAIYMSDSIATGMRELDRLASSAAVDPTALLSRGYELHTIKIHELQILDLREKASLAHVGLDLEDIADDDRAACQAVGHAAWFLEAQGVVAPSATGIGLVITAFENRLNPDQLRLISTRLLDEAIYLGSARPSAG